MAIPNRQIGQSAESNALWQISKQLEYLTKVTSATGTGGTALAGQVALTTGTGGTTPYKLIATSSTNANVVKASAGNLYAIVAIGLTSTVRYLKFYNKATAPVVGTDVPVLTIPVPANTQGAGVSIPVPVGINFTNGIGIAITSGSADNDTVAIVAGDVVVNLVYA